MTARRARLRQKAFIRATALGIYFLFFSGGVSRSQDEIKKADESYDVEVRERELVKELLLGKWPVTTPAHDALEAISSGELEIILPYPVKEGDWENDKNVRRDLIDHAIDARKHYYYYVFPPTIETHFFLPKTATEFAQVYGFEPSSPALGDMQRSSEHLRREFGVPGPDTYASAATISGVIAGSKAEVVMLVGHNQNNQMTFLDGSTIPMSSLLDTAALHNKKLIFVSCEARAVVEQQSQGRIGTATATELTIDQAIDVAKYVTAHIADKADRNNNINMDSIASLLNQAENRSVFTARVKYVAKVVHRSMMVSLGTALVYVVICDLDSDHSCEMKAPPPGPGPK